MGPDIISKEEYEANLKKLDEQFSKYPEAKLKVYSIIDDIYAGNLKIVEEKLQAKIGKTKKDESKLKGFLDLNGQIVDSTYLQAATIKGNLPMMKMIKKYTSKLNEFLYVSAALSDDLKIVKYIHSIKCPINNFIINKIETFAKPEIVAFIKTIKF